MYRCESCHAIVGPRVRAHRIVVETRSKNYRFRLKANRPTRRRERDKSKEKYIDDPGGVGVETAREKTICPSCADLAQHGDIRQVG
jgi:hypothetical protein